MTQGERVKFLRKSLNMTLDEFGEHIGLRKSTLSVIENDKSGLTNAASKSICREFGVNLSWLISEEGEMFDKSIDALLPAFHRIMSGDDDFHRNLLRWCIGSLTSEELRVLKKIFSSLRDVGLFEDL